MKSIILVRLLLRNFKGIREFVFDTNNGNVDIHGDNAVGKTTVFDGFTWLLFDKDSTNRKDFEIKTLDKDGNAIPGLEHEVEGVLLIDGRQITLRKVFAEKWTKKRGSATAEFTGHSTDYFIDGVPVKQKEYKDRIDQIVSEDIFKLLTSPTYFNEQLKWQDRRKILLDICGDISDEDVIASNKELTKLPEILNGRSIEDHRKVIAAKRADINKELDKIPVRIDEAQRSMPDTNGLDEETLQREIAILKERIESKDAESFRLRSGGQIALKENQLREIEGKLLEIKNRLQVDTLDKVAAKRQEVSKLKSEYSNLKQSISDKQWTIDRNSQRIGDHQFEAGRLRKEWHEVNGEVFESIHDESCPTCGQSLPEDQIKAAHDKALTDFNRRKSERLEQISIKGKAAKAESDRLTDENNNLSAQIDTLNQQLIAKEAELQSAEAELNQLQAAMIDVEADPEFIAKQQEATAIKQEIEQLRNSIQEAVGKVQEEISGLRSRLAELEQNKAKFSQVGMIEKRIEELKEQEKTLSSKYERLEKELYLTDVFVKTKVDLLESRINNKFKIARFKMFNQLINGGIEDCCEVLVNGVPYTNLNSAGRIQVGLDVITTLQDYYKFSAPIWIDNRESIVMLPKMGCQVISLIVSEADKNLRIETEKGDSGLCQLVSNY